MLKLYYIVFLGLLYTLCYQATLTKAAAVDTTALKNDTTTTTTTNNNTNNTITTSQVPVDEPLFEKKNATALQSVIPKFNCAKPRQGGIDLSTRTEVIHDMYDHYKRGQWGQKCYSNGWCVDARDLGGWNSPQDCMNVLRYKLIECLQQNAGDGYVEQQAGFARCMMHYWCDGC